MFFARILILIFISSLLFSACDRPGVVLPSKTGKWYVSKRRTFVTANGSTVSDVTQNGVGMMTFEKDGTGTTTVDSTGSFTWDWISKTRKVAITHDTYIISYDVLSSEKNFQRWFYWTEYDFWGVKTRTEVTLEMYKQKYD